VPYALYDEIVSGYSAQSTRLHLYRPNPVMVRQCERALAIAELFETDPNTLSWAQQQLVRAYRATGQEDRAMELAAEVLDNAQPGRLEYGEHALVPEYVWMLRLAGRPEDALAEIDRWIQLLDGVIVASLAGEVSEDEAKAFLARLAGWASDGSPLTLGENPLGDYFISRAAIASVLRGAFRSSRGKEYARQIAFREVPFADCMRLPMLVIAFEAMRQTGMGTEVTDEQDAVVWELVEAGYSALFETGAVSKAQMFQLALTWKGITNFLGWAGVAPALEPELRGPIAYILGHRYLRLNRPEDARTFFRSARDDAPDGSRLKALAQAELDRLAGDASSRN